MDAAEREGSMQTKVGDKLKNVPGQYKHRASYDFLNGMFKVCAGGFCIAECEDSEVADAICLMWNADLRPTDRGVKVSEEVVRLAYQHAPNWQAVADSLNHKIAQRKWCNKCGWQPCDCFKLPASDDEFRQTEIALLRGRLRTIGMAGEFGATNAEVVKRLAELENTQDQARQYMQHAQQREHRINELEAELLALRVSEPEPQVWPICKWCLTDLERWVRQSGKCPACGAIDWMEKPTQPETPRCATHGTLMVKRELGYYCDKCQPETGAVRYPQRATHCEKISEEDAAKAIAAAQKQIRKIEDAHIRRAWEQPDAVRELPEKWEKEWPLSESMDHCYAINAHAVHACAAELRAALSREEKPNAK